MVSLKNTGNPTRHCRSVRATDAEWKSYRALAKKHGVRLGPLIRWLLEMLRENPHWQADLKRYKKTGHPPGGD